MNPLEELVKAARNVLDYDSRRCDKENLLAALATIEHAEVETRWEVQKMFVKGDPWYRWFSVYVDGEAQRQLASRKKTQYYETSIVQITTIRSVVE